MQSIYATTIFGTFWLVVTCLNIYVETSLYAGQCQWCFVPALQLNCSVFSTSCAIWILRLLNARSHSCLFADHVHARKRHIGFCSNHLSFGGRCHADEGKTALSPVFSREGRRPVQSFTLTSAGRTIILLVSYKRVLSHSSFELSDVCLWYSSTILFFLINFAIICSPPTPTGAEYLIAIVYIAFTNMMACRVFRGVALGRMHVEVAGLTSTRIAAVFQ